MYAIIKDGGKQYKVFPGKAIELEKKDLAPGEKVEFTDVVFYQNKDQVEVGAPFVAKVKVQGVVEKHEKGKKITIIKYRRREDSRSKKGHRQNYVKVRIQKIVKE